MASTRSAYDPYNNISYLQINKSRRGERERSENEKIYNRPPPTVKKIFLKPNGDARFRPRLFMWRVWRIPRLNGLIQEAGEFLGFEKGVAEKLYALDGDLIEDEEEIIDGNTYIVAGNEPFDLSSISVPPSKFQASSSANNAYSVVMEPGAATDWRSEFGEIPPKPHEAINTAFSYADQLEEFDEDTVVGSARSYVEKHREQRNDVKSRPVTLRSEAEELPRLSGVTNATHNLENGFIEKGEKNVRERKRKTNTICRSKADAIYNRRDQTHPNAYIIYVFLNGRGMESQFMKFQRAQLEKGIKFVLELIARRFGVKPGKLCNMDGQRIREVSDLMSRGAYVLIPVGQSFRETWYFLPDNAIDTSEDNEKVLQRSEQRDRLIQRRLRHEAAIRSNITNNRRPPQLQKDKSRLRTMSSPLSASTSKLCNGRSESEDSRVEADQHYAHRPQKFSQPRSRSAEAYTYSNSYQQVRPGRYFSNLKPG